MTRVYALANQKGGVGKTTTAVSLGAYLAQSGKRVLLVDVDPQANATSSLGVDKHQVSRSTYDALIDDALLDSITVLTTLLHLDLAPSSPALAGAEVEMVAMERREYLLRAALQPILARYDYILIDTPPSLGLLTVNALAAADNGVIVPVQCEYLALEGLTELMRTIELVRNRLNPLARVAGVVLTMYDGRTNLAQQVVDQVRKHFGPLVFQAVVPRSIRLSEAPSYGEPILVYAPGSYGALAYQALAAELEARD
jgi:chromosome partitioning protein